MQALQQNMFFLNASVTHSASLDIELNLTDRQEGRTQNLEGTKKTSSMEKVKRESPLILNKYDL